MASFLRNRFLLAVVASVVCAAVAGGIYLALRPHRPKNVILIVMDTTRADHLTPYGYERDTSPNLKKFADENTVFDYAIASAPWTPMSVGSLITGLYPISHGFLPPDNRPYAEKNLERLDDKLTTIAEALKAHGYQNFGVTPNPWTSKLFGFDQGFDKYIFRDRVPADGVTKIAKEMFRTRDRSKPTFMFVHYLDPHWPYKPPAPYDKMFTEPLKAREYPEQQLKWMNQYDGEIAFMDSQIEELFSYLKSEKVYDDSLIIVIADHGEQFLEHGRQQHGNQLFNEEEHVPLMIHDGSAPHHVDYTVSNIDVFPTILDELKLPALPANQGISLLNDDAQLKRPGVLMEISREFNWRGFVSLEKKKIIFDFAQSPDHPVGSLVGVFDPVADPAELNPFDDKKLIANLTSHFEAAFRPLEKSAGSAQKVEIDPETLQQLKSLGYMK